MRTLVLLSFLVLSGGAAASAGPTSPDSHDQDIIQEAESAFAEGVRLRHDAAQARPHFRRAAEQYDLLRRAGADNALLYRNLGNCWLLAGDLPRAILSYHQGLLVAPGDRELQSALDRAAHSSARADLPSGPVRPDRSRRIGLPGCPASRDNGSFS